MIIVDTNVISEVIKPDPSVEVTGWLARERPSNIFTTAIAQAELLYGIELMPRGRRKSALEAAITRILRELLVDRILPFDSDAAIIYSRIAASRRAMGRPISEPDAQIAAIAHSRGAALATRNASDFEHCGIKVLNPWA
jgi:predicted nucleic acid-binding protein